MIPSVIHLCNPEPYLLDKVSGVICGPLDSIKSSFSRPNIGLCGIDELGPFKDSPEQI